MAATHIIRERCSKSGELCVKLARGARSVGFILTVRREQEEGSDKDRDGEEDPEHDKQESARTEAESEGEGGGLPGAGPRLSRQNIRSRPRRRPVRHPLDSTQRLPDASRPLDLAASRKRRTGRSLRTTAAGKSKKGKGKAKAKDSNGNAVKSSRRHKNGDRSTASIPEVEETAEERAARERVRCLPLVDAHHMTNHV